MIVIWSVLKSNITLLSFVCFSLVAACSAPPHHLLLDGKTNDWNKWRAQQGKQINLSGLKLNNLDLRGFSLVGADLGDSDLAGSDLRGVNLNSASWQNTNLTKTKLLAGLKSDVSSGGAKNVAAVHWQYAASEQATVIKKGAQAWNAWRKKNPDALVDLTGQVFKKISFKGYDLSGGNLRGGGFIAVSFAGADLSNADLRETDFSRINFDGANLSGARLGASDMRFASFAGCKFRGAKIAEIVDGTNVIRADLRGANLKGADLRGAIVTVIHPVTQKKVGARLTSVKVPGAKIPIKYKGFFQKQNAKGAPIWIK